MDLTKQQKSEIIAFIDFNNYTFSLNDLLEEYKKYKAFEYVSFSFKKVLKHFDKIFTRENK